jgi:malonyl-CoA O-methyltransferase
MAEIDRSKVRKAFDRGACRYEETVIVQKLVIEKFLAKLDEMSSCTAPRRILDVGAGTGMLLRSLRKIYPESFLAGLDLAPGMGSEARSSLRKEGDILFVEGDAEHLPFADGSFDLVVSTSTFQWLAMLEHAFSEAKRVLMPGGTFLFALFGEGTLQELKNSYRCALIAENALDKDRSHHFFTRDEVANTLAELGFSAVTVENAFEREYYPDVPSFLRSLKGIGAGSAAPLPSKGLGGRRIITKMTDYYQRIFSDGRGIPASYEVIYGKGEKK